MTITLVVQGVLGVRNAVASAKRRLQEEGYSVTGIVAVRQVVLGGSGRRNFEVEVTATDDKEPF